MRKIFLLLIILLISAIPLLAEGTTETPDTGSSSSGSSSSGGLDIQTSTTETQGTGASSAATNAWSSTTSSSPQIVTSLTAGTATGTFVGFSSRSYDDGISAISVLELTLSDPSPKGDLTSLTASGEFYVYWIVSNIKSDLNLKLSWTQDVIGLTVTDLSDNEITSGDTVVTLSSGTSGTSSMGFNVVTEDLLLKPYSKTYTVEFTIKAESAS